MTSRPIQLVNALAALALAAGCAHNPQPTNAAVMSTVIVITNTGSTNTIGYRVLIGSNGQASYSSGTGSGQADLPGPMFERLKHDIAAASPLASLPAPSCMKSASFGTSTFIVMGGDRSPDLSCPATGTALPLEQDIAAVVSFLNVRNVAHGQGTELPPLNF